VSLWSGVQGALVTLAHEVIALIALSLFFAFGADAAATARALTRRLIKVLRG
jgi:hypothetical protein